ncbi:MAG: DUF3450 domain-containing protein [Planctomycetes bacterium]|nr:DUF3450 domain-containing protein [Planctomycetota bacterium]
MAAGTKLVALSLTALLAVSGCTTPAATTAAAGAQTQSGKTTAQRFQDASLEGRTAVDSAIELSEKYATLSDQTATLRQDNQRLTTENEGLRQQVASLEARIKQTQKELGEANELLIEMLTELNTWKSNVLGFRGEMRQAAQAQLEAMLKILEILGGQSEAEVLERQHAGTLRPDVNDVTQTAEPPTPIQGELHGAK